MLTRLRRMCRYCRARIYEDRADRAFRRGDPAEAVRLGSKAEEIFRSLDVVDPVETAGDRRRKAEAPHA